VREKATDKKTTVPVEGTVGGTKGWKEDLESVKTSKDKENWGKKQSDLARREGRDSHGVTNSSRAEKN